MRSRQRMAWNHDAQRNRKSHGYSLPVVPFAATTFVYQGCDGEYATWLDDLAPLIAEGDGDEFEQTEAIRAFLKSKEAPLRHASKTRKRRLQQLTLDADNLPGVEHVRLLTREVVFPEDILPFSGLRASLARGAADVLKHWQDQKNLGDFGPVVTRLREAWEKEKKDHWTPTLLATATAVQHEVAGDAKQTSSQVLWVKAVAYDRMVGKRFEEALREAVPGKQRLEQIAADIATEITKNGPSDERLQQQARCQMFIGLATLNLQEMAKAREILLGVEPSRLTEKAKLQLVGALVVVGEVERAKVMLPAKESVSQNAWETWEDANQSVMLGEGIIHGHKARRCVAVSMGHRRGGYRIVAGAFTGKQHTREANDVAIHSLRRHEKWLVVSFHRPTATHPNNPSATIPPNPAKLLSARAPTRTISISSP